MLQESLWGNEAPGQLTYRGNGARRSSTTLENTSALAVRFYFPGCPYANCSTARVPGGVIRSIVSKAGSPFTARWGCPDTCQDRLALEP